jgi:hypothetical protein
MKTYAVIVALTCLVALSGCDRSEGAGGPDAGESPTSAGQTPSGAGGDGSAEESPGGGDDDLVDEDTLPVGHCGKAPAKFKGQKFYQGSKETDCHEGYDVLEAFANGEGDDSDASGHGTEVNGWSCVFPMDDEIKNYALTLLCEKGSQQIFVRPGSLELPAGYHVKPWDYGATADSGGQGLYFTTESRKHHCNFAGDVLGCDNHNFPADLPEVEYMGEKQQPTAVELESSGKPRFAVYGDPTYTLSSGSGEWGADTQVLGYGQLLYAYGIACTTDETVGVACSNKDHGFEISSRDYTFN